MKDKKWEFVSDARNSNPTLRDLAKKEQFPQTTLDKILVLMYLEFYGTKK